MKRILVAGDSHSAFWRGRNGVANKGTAFVGVDVLHIGPATAHMLFVNGEPHRRNAVPLTTKLKADVGKYAALVLCFGEIDCRVHVVKSALSNKISIDQAVDLTIARYMEFIDWIKSNWEIPIVLWGPPPSTPETGKISFNPRLPAIGSMYERNYAAFCFTEALKREAAKRLSVEVASIFEECVDSSGATVESALCDGCHLDVRMMRHAIPALLDAIERLGLGCMSGNFARHWPVLETARVRNVAASLVPKVSSWAIPSTDQRRAELPDSVVGKPVIRTSSENKPWVLLDLAAGYFVKKIELLDSQGKEIHDTDIIIEQSLDKISFLPASNENLENPTRFIRIQLGREGRLEFGTIRVLAPKFEVRFQDE
ncbi:hypothetical protein JMJ55_15680 [Belnapia sp. T6]|uniref:Uncharacterized protein n=1 Tax=Belnapia mucosa TaxID=2804532 RepID=A0ABS1V582_9PROT|nr:hypothetical protein [Belnapia mucosa]MBL6456777.1 hypothetical protein [Belnapia mucosa]